MEKPTWQLLMYNTNHMQMGPQTIITSSSYELCDHIMNNLSDIFKNNGYKSFKLMIQCRESGVVIRDAGSM